MSLRARELAGIDAVGQADLVRRGEATPLELVDAAMPGQCYAALNEEARIALAAVR